MSNTQGIFNPLFEASSKELIETFGDSPSSDVSPEDITKAEEAVEEEQSETNTSVDDFDEMTLLQMSDNQLLQIRFTPKFEYGTPSGGEDVKCGNCGTADAGDVVIIDAEIAPVEGDSSDTDLAPEIEMYADLRKEFQLADEFPRLSHLESIASMEGFSDTIQKLIGVLKTLTLKVAKYARRTYIFARKKISSSLLRLETVHKLWKFKLGRNMDRVDIERLNSMEIEAFPYATWIDAAKLGLNAFEMVQNADRIIFDHGDNAVTNSMQFFQEKMKDIGITMNVVKNRINWDGLLDTRLHDSVPSLGYTKSQLPNCIRYLGDIAKRTPKGQENNLETVTNKSIERVTLFAAQINQAVLDGRMDKQSKEYKDAANQLVNYTVRLDFVLNCMRLTYTLFDFLTKDMLHVFSKYEDAMTSEVLV